MPSVKDVNMDSWKTNERLRTREDLGRVMIFEVLVVCFEETTWKSSLAGA